jgi:hypothetical protein
LTKRQPPFTQVGCIPLHPAAIKSRQQLHCPMPPALRRAVQCFC